ncbi:unnamed protein product [Adineta steineri]|uniref:Uncharacterized protein n=1 Tax=Adineta steineri TaxID=433720 RepID=A0A813UXX0_9BILA|nr:unnamed protein product [Adineta steineri]CAF3650449.1 unnamed protein product [Adineta steineri]
MEAIFIFLTSSVIISTCSARYYYSSGCCYGSSLPVGATVGLVVGIVAVVVIATIISIYCKVKQTKRRRINNIPTAMQMAALAQEENRYKPPGNNQIRSNNQPPPYSQPQPYVQPPPYAEPPRYSAVNNEAQSARITPVS